MAIRHPALVEVVRRDPRYAYDAYEFVIAAYGYTQKLLGRPPRRDKPEEQPENHVSGRQLLEGVRALVLREYGLMARTVLHSWGIRTTDDVGNIVFNLLDAGLMSKRPEDALEDFHNVFDLDAALERDYQIKPEDLE
jgi:uncharacterized repeat protein (TIGR04138 family)